MTCPGPERHFDLDDGAALHLDDARGNTLRVTRGRLWVTQHGDARDIVLQAGDAWTIERNGLTIAAAQAPTSVVIAGRAARRLDARGRRLPWFDRVAAWFARLDDARVGRRWAPYV
ncbi:MAG: DUF2917 domain-containing protein [Burkholderiales bacterium]|nr:DUF2917 domain-containing protein [Burkholderiales bacterium]GIK85308.1 MAG: hypothetical protein BroJett026_07890 [Betaproteobacteria bacterium]